MVVCIRIEVSTFIMLNLFFQICNVVLNLLYDLVPYESAIFVSFNKVVINKNTGCNILQ